MDDQPCEYCNRDVCLGNCQPAQEDNLHFRRLRDYLANPGYSWKEDTAAAQWAINRIAELEAEIKLTR